MFFFCDKDERQQKNTATKYAYKDKYKDKDKQVIEIETLESRCLDSQLLYV